VPRAGRNHVDMVFLDVPAQLFVLRHGLCHGPDHLSWKNLFALSPSTARIPAPPRPLIADLSCSPADYERVAI
jgi:hypothetical protein